MQKNDRTYVRPLTMNDVNETYVSWLNDPQVTFFLDTQHTTLAELKTYVEKKLGSEHCRFLGIFLVATDSLIGTAKFEPIDWTTGVAEFGFMIGDKKVWGDGIGVEAAKNIIQ